MEQVAKLIIELLEKRSIGAAKLITVIQAQDASTTEAQIKETIDALIKSGDVVVAGGEKRKFLNLNAKRRTPMAVAVERFVLENGSVTRGELNAFVENFMTEHGLFHPEKKHARQVWGATLGLLRDKTFNKTTVDGVEKISVTVMMVPVPATEEYLEPVAAPIPHGAGAGAWSGNRGVETVVESAIAETDPGFIAA